MRNIIGLAMTLALALTGSAAIGEQAPLGDGRPVPGPDPMVMGVYDPYGDFTNSAPTRIEHLFLPWLDVDLATLALADSYAQERGRSLWITAEPWTWDRSQHEVPDELRDGILAGAYDGIIAGLCGEIARLRSPVTVRFAQEMEDRTGRFIWSGWAPADYVAAYRHFVTQCRSAAPQARFMWSPKGDDGLELYYPGDEFVDDIGLSIFDLQQFDHDKYGRDRYFVERVKPGYDRVVGFDKPIYIAELGYVGDPTFVARWAREALRKFPEFPKLVGVAYFNDTEIAPWPAPYGLPDWRTTHNILD